MIRPCWFGVQGLDERPWTPVDAVAAGVESMIAEWSRANRCTRWVAVAGLVSLPIAVWRAQSTRAALDVRLIATPLGFEIHAEHGARGSVPCIAAEAVASILRRAGDASLRGTSQEFRIPPAAPPATIASHAFDALGGRRVGATWWLDPLLLPRATDRPTHGSSRVDSPEGSFVFDCDVDRREIAVAGVADRVLFTSELGTAVVAPRRCDVRLAEDVARWIDRIDAIRKVRIASTKPGRSPRYWIAAEWGGEDGREPLERELFSNVVRGPFPENSGEIGFQVAGRALVERLCEGGVSPFDPYAIAVAAAGADLLSEALGGGAPRLAGRLAAERQRLRGSRLSDPARYSRRDPLVGLRTQEIAVQFLGPRARAALIAKFGHCDPPDATFAGRFMAWLDAGIDDATLVALCDPDASRSDAIASCRADSVVDPPLPPTPGASICVELANDQNGYLESCGCKAMQGGGLIDLYQYWRAPRRSDTLRVLLGGVVSEPGNAGYSRAANELIIASARNLSVTAWVPGVRELLLLAAGELPRDAFAGLPFVACNVRPRSGHAPLSPFIDVPTRAGTCRLIGVFRLSARHATRRSAALIEAAYRVEDPVTSVVDEIRRTPDEDAIVIAGSVEPRCGAEIASRVRRPLLFCSNDGLLPRMVGDTIERDQVDGSVRGQPIVFSPPGAYQVKRVGWSPGNGVTVESLCLATEAGDPAARAEFHALVRPVLEQESGPVELRFVDPDESPERRFVGSERCASCHRAEYDDWLTTPHSEAWRTLQHVQRQQARNCVACHVVGWGHASGYDFDRPDDTLRNVGCEVCHGPGGEHIALDGAKRAIRRAPAPSRCVACHTPDHSNFDPSDPATYVAAIDHHRARGGH